MVIPKSLARINAEQSHLCHFRVRDCSTLEDYCILWPKSMNGGLPDWFVALRLDSYLLKTEVRGDWDNYVLLSTEEESTALSRMNDKVLHATLNSGYNKKREVVKDLDLIGTEAGASRGVYFDDDSIGP